MKALLLLGVWMGLGCAVAFRRPLPALDRVLAVLFWPFFLGGEPAPVPASPVAQLARVLAPEPTTAGLARSLLAEEARLTDSIARLEAAASGATGRSAGVLDAAQGQAVAALARLRDLADEAHARLLVAAAQQGGAPDVLADLRAHVSALDEVGG